MSDHEHNEHSHDEHDHGGTGKYWVVFVALCVLTGASFFTYSPLWPFKETPWVGWAFMMIVSCTKAMLVICFFMHLIWEASWKYVLTIPAGMMSIFLAFMLVLDVGYRTHHYSSERWLHSAEPTAAESHGHGDSEEHGDGSSHAPNGDGKAH